MKQKTNKGKTIESLADFIESLVPENLLGLNKKQWEELRRGSISYTSFPLIEWVSETKDNTIVIKGDDWNEINDFKKSIYRFANQKGHKFSKEFITKTIQRAISIHILIKRGNNTEYNSVLKFLKKKFNENPKTFHVFIEIEGLILKKYQKLEFGSCTFYKMTLPKVKKMLRFDSWQFKNKRQALEARKNKFINKTYAEILVKANDEKAAMRNAKIYLTRVIDILNFFAGIYHDYDSWSGNIRIPIFENKPKTTIIHVYDEDESVKSIDSYIIEHIYDFRIEEMKNNKVYNYHYKKVVKLMNESANNDFINRFLTSIQWAGKAMWEQKNEISFLTRIIHKNKIYRKTVRNSIHFS